MQARKSRSGSEILQSILQAPNKGIFQQRILEFIIKQIEYLGRRSEINNDNHLKLMYLAKVRPDAYRLPDVKKFLTITARSGPLPPALATTLFMVHGYISAESPYPPVVMAYLLIHDVTGAREFCRWEKADVMIRRVQLHYFSESSCLSRLTKLRLYQHSNPQATDIPDTWTPYSAEDIEAVKEVQIFVDRAVAKLDTGKFEQDAIECLVYFFQMPNCRAAFIKHFQHLCIAVPSIIPRVFKAVEFFFEHSNPEDSRVQGFLRKFHMLAPERFGDEFKKALGFVKNLSPRFDSILITSQINAGSRIVDQNIASTINVMLARADLEPIESIQQSFQDLQPTFLYAAEFLMNLMELVPRNEIGAERVWEFFVILFSIAHFGDNVEHVTELVRRYIAFMRGFAGSRFYGILEKSTNVVVPEALMEKGLPFCCETLTNLLDIPPGLNLAYRMICAAAVYQTRTGKIPIVGLIDDSVARSLELSSNSRMLHVAASYLILKALLIVVNPDGIGRQLYARREHRPLFLKFLAVVLSDRKSGYIGLNDGLGAFVEPQAAEAYILRFARQSFLSSGFLLCKDPCYLEDLIIDAGIEVPVPVWVQRISCDSVKRIGTAAVVRFVLLKLIAGIDLFSDRTFNGIFGVKFRANWIHQLSDLITTRSRMPEETIKLCGMYADFLRSQHSQIRLAAYVLITWLNTPIGQEPEDLVFALPNETRMLEILRDALLIDSARPMCESYLDFIGASNDRIKNDIVSQIVKERPLLCMCLGHPVLGLRWLQNSGGYDCATPLNFQYFAYEPLKVSAKAGKKQGYRALPKNRRRLRELGDFPVRETEVMTAQVNKQDVTEETVTPRDSVIDVEVYRCEVALHEAPADSWLRPFALASLKRLIVRSSRAFLCFAEHSLVILVSEFGHVQIITSSMIDMLSSFLIVCIFRLESVRAVLDDAEVKFFGELSVFLTNMDVAQLEGERFVLALRNYLLKREMNLDEFNVPLDVPWETLMSHNHLWAPFVTSIKLGGSEYAEKWMMKAILNIGCFGRNELLEKLFVPLILGSSGEVVALFFAAARDVDEPVAWELRKKVFEVISSLHSAAGFPNKGAV